ncbi:hypothetical protein [Ectopseudomonas guguanensis]|jgi:hypothetical protein|uniref:Uncharacterized protein n=1 Tax=Tilletia indica TaxID=43049 RepID=A0A8T8SDH1_9BASI|nr:MULTISPECIES: hypothetical protein [Pseudomonas]KAE8237321.1 hypothetical protein A4X13_0g8831 [Tilletia indica]MDV5860556.1 hypothetical protein [Pseudomonas mendocina]MPT18424.1 hypothetical protein [Pseudomonas sp.]WJH58130.1 hypothetical protein FE254_19080 [Pseudomonas guguanensis]
MKNNRHPFAEPFFDPYRIGFALYRPDKPNWRQRTIAGVSWDGRAREAYFFNPDGLVLPLEPHPWNLPPLLGQYAVRQEFAHVEGIGLFAMKPAQLEAMSSARLGDWVTYWLVGSDAHYANEAGTWAEYAEARAAQAREDVEWTTKQQADRWWPEHLRQVPSAHQFEGAGSREQWECYRAAADQLQQQRADHVKHLQSEAEQESRSNSADDYARQCAYDKRINAWLRGEAGGPPLLALMQGVA